jgi:Flp pilus assembly pilin Flp
MQRGLVGQGMVEYGLIIMLVALVAAVGIGAFGINLGSFYSGLPLPF